jgi:tetratricopeptide (TPR) repeat protein
MILASAALYDVGAGRPVRELKGSYARDDGPGLAKALLATVTGGLGLRAGMLKELVSPPAYPYYVQALALIQRDLISYDQAIPLFQKAIELDPRSALPYAGLAEAEIQKFNVGYGQPLLDQAQGAVAQAKSLNPDAVPVLLASGQLNRAQGYYEQAVRDLTRATELEPNNPFVWRGLASVYAGMNRSEDAIATYRKAIAVQPGYYGFYFDFGMFYYSIARYKEAEESMRHVTMLAPNLAPGHTNLGIILMDQGRYREAEVEMLASLKLREARQVLNDLGLLYAYQRRDGEAVRFYERSLAVGPPNTNLFLNLGDTYRRLGREREAAEAYRRGMTMAEQNLVDNPRTSASRARLALFSARLGDRSGAEFEVAQALRMAPEDNPTMRLAALTYEVLKQRNKTLDILRNAPAPLLGDLSRQPDLEDLQADARFVELLKKATQ